MTNRFFFFFLIGLFLVFSCENEDDNPQPNPDNPNALNKIMPLGASRVEGARPVFESYRYELWKQLQDNNWEVDFIGTMRDEASYPVHQGVGFDQDHEGRGGWTSGQILNGINGWLDRAGAPDIVLFSSPGGNDALTAMPYDEAVANVNSIIDALQAANPNVTIIIEQMAPARSDLMTPALTTYFMDMQKEVLSIASEQTTATSRVVTVDMFTGFSDSFFADDVHYNEAGASFIAERYYDVLKDLLLR